MAVPPSPKWRRRPSQDGDALLNMAPPSPRWRRPSQDGAAHPRTPPVQRRLHFKMAPPFLLPPQDGGRKWRRGVLPVWRSAWSRGKKKLFPFPKMAAAAAGPCSFVGLSPGSRDPAAPRSRRPRGSRNRKKGWKRWAGPEARLGREIGDFLEDVALQQRATGGLLSEQPDEGLFFLDTGSAQKDHPKKKKKKEEKPLHVDLVLQPQSKVPPPKNILAYQVPNGRKEKRRREFWAKKEEKGVLPPPERRLQKRLRRRGRGGGGGAPTPTPPKEKTLEKGRSDPQRGFYDIWGGDAPLDRSLVGQDPWFLQQTKKQRVKRPPTVPPKGGGQVPAVEVIAPGGSYNPTFQDHQALLLQAHQLELRKRREEEKVEKRLKVPPGTERPSAETLLREQSEGLLEEEEEEEEEEPESQENAPKWGPPPERKTEKQRRKEKEARALRLRLRGEKAARVRAQALFRLRGLRRELERRGGGGGARAAKRRRRDTLPPRLGPRKYEEPPPEVQLSEELAGSLRGLKPEGSVLRERFKSLQKRNLIEPRERAKFKRRYRLKYVEKRAFREVTL